MDTSKISAAQQQAEIARLQRSLAAAEKQLQELAVKYESVQQDNDDLSEKLLTRAKNKGDSSVLIDRLNTLRSQLRDAERSRDQALTDASELRNVMQKYVDQIQTIDGDSNDEELEAVRRELEIVRQQAQKDVIELKEKIEEQASSSQFAAQDSENILELEVLRQESEIVSQSLVDRQQELHVSQQTCQLLEDELEDAHAKIDELRRQLEKKLEPRRVEEEAKEKAIKPVEDLLIESYELDEDMAQSVPVVNIKASMKPVSSFRQRIISVAIGITVTVIFLEVLSMASGKGELFQSLLGSQITPQQDVSNTSQHLPSSVNVSTGHILRN